MRCGMQGDVAAPRRPTRRLRGNVTHIYIYLSIGYNIYVVFRLSEEIINRLKPSHIIYRFISLNFFHVGLSPTQFLSAGHVVKGEASDRRRMANPHVDRVDSRSTGDHQCTCFK